MTPGRPRFWLSTLPRAAPPATDSYGILFYDDVLGLLPVVRQGDMLLGGTIVQLDFNVSAASDSNEQSGINSAQVAYQFILADGRAGFAIGSAPYAATSCQG